MTFKSILYFMKNVCLHNVGTKILIRLDFKQKIKLRTSMAFKFPLHKMKKLHLSYIIIHKFFLSKRCARKEKA